MVAPGALSFGVLILALSLGGRFAAAAQALATATTIAAAILGHGKDLGGTVWA